MSHEDTDTLRVDASECSVGKDDHADGTIAYKGNTENRPPGVDVQDDIEEGS